MSERYYEILEQLNSERAQFEREQLPQTAENQYSPSSRKSRIRSLAAKTFILAGLAGITLYSSLEGLRNRRERHRIEQETRDIYREISEKYSLIVKGQPRETLVESSPIENILNENSSNKFVSPPNSLQGEYFVANSSDRSSLGPSQGVGNDIEVTTTSRFFAERTESYNFEGEPMSEQLKELKKVVSKNPELKEAFGDLIEFVEKNQEPFNDPNN